MLSHINLVILTRSPDQETKQYQMILSVEKQNLVTFGHFRELIRLTKNRIIFKTIATLISKCIVNTNLYSLSILTRSRTATLFKATVARSSKGHNLE